MKKHQKLFKHLSILFSSLFTILLISNGIILKGQRKNGGFF